MKTLISILILALCFSGVVAAGPKEDVYEEVRVGLVVDLSSIQGKILETSFCLALSDFYGINNGYRTRVTIFFRDSQGDPILALAAANDLLKNAKVEAIVGAQSLQEAKLLAAISEKAKVPVISTLVPSSLSLNKYDHFIQMTHDTTSEAKGITSLIQDFDWEPVVVVLYEDADGWRESLQILVENFQDEGIHIACSASFAVSSSGENHMMNQLRKLKVSRTTVFVVHMSEILVSRLFKCVEMLGLMEEGYAWILTVRTMNYVDHFATIRSMQGVIGFKSYIPVSDEVENFTSRLRKLMGDDTETEHSSEVIGVRAHDIACILATAVEKLSLRGKDEASLNVSDLLETIRHSRFKGLSGEIKIIDNKFLLETFEMVSIVGEKETRIGLWSSGSFSQRKHILWHGGSGEIPRHRILAENGEKKVLRVLVTAGNKIPNLVSVRPDPVTGVNTVSGFCVEVFKTCIARFNYELEFIPYRGNNDNLLSTQSDKYDAAVGDITITFNRSLYVEFTLPYTDIGIGILTVKKKNQGMWTFFDPFEKSLWLASGAFFVLTGVVVWLVERPVNPEFQGTWGQQLSMMLWFGFSTIVFAHREKLQKMSSRFLVIVWVFVVLILTSSYGANLTSTKTISRMQLNHQAVFGGSPTLSSMKLGSINAVEAYAQVLRDGTLSHVINEIPYLSILIGNYPNEFVMTDRTTNTNGFGFMFQKGSDLVPNVSREIAKLRSLGMLRDMEKRWFGKLDSLNVHSNTADVASPNNDDEASKRFTFRELRGLFIIAGVAHTLVLALHIFHIVERCCDYSPNFKASISKNKIHHFISSSIAFDREMSCKNNHVQL